MVEVPLTWELAKLGLFWGTLAGFLAATLWLLGWMQFTAWQQRRNA